MKKGIVSIFIILFLFSSFAFAAKYKLTGYKVTPTQFYVLDNITNTNYSSLDIAKTIAAYEWNDDFTQINMNHTTNENLNPIVEISAISNPYTTMYGSTAFMAAPYRHQVTINHYQVADEANGDYEKEKKIAKFIIMHEYGHLFGLDDLVFLIREIQSCHIMLVKQVY